MSGSSSRSRLIFLVHFTLLHLVQARWNDSYDLANLRRDYLTKYCVNQNHLEEFHNLENFLNCTKPGLRFPNIVLENITAENVWVENKESITSWCLSSWPTQLLCEAQHEESVEKCFSASPTVSVGFDIMTAFFRAACHKQKTNISSIAYLAIFRKNLRRWWFQERDVVSCFSQVNLEYYKRDINMVLNCIKYQLRYRKCPNHQEECEDLLVILENDVKSEYKSSGYVYLNSYNLSLINTDFPIAPESRRNNNCQNNGRFAYIAFFSLLVILLITLGLFVSAKVKCINFQCYHGYQSSSSSGHQELVQDEGSNSIEM